MQLGINKRAIAMAAATLAVAGSATIGIAGTADAAVRPMADCGATWNDVGAPGNLYGYGFYYGTWTYAGQVEQQYQNCGGGVVNARAHFQWSSGFQSQFAGTMVQVDIESGSYGPTTGSSVMDSTVDKNVNSPGFEIHNAKPDHWAAEAQLVGTTYGCSPVARGTDWYYGTGTPQHAPVTGYCG